MTAEGQKQAAARHALSAASITQPLAQHIPADTILKLLRVHSYDVDFKQKVKPGDTFDVFFDVPRTTPQSRATIMTAPASCSTPR